MYQIVYMGSYNDVICKTILNFKNISLQGVIVDTSIPFEDIQYTRSFFLENNIPNIELTDIEAIKPDMVFVCGYTKIIRSELLKKYLFINIHAGVLPKWRGFSANAWAIINDEKQVGYSFHRVTDEIDGGDIYHKIIIKLNEDEKYGDARNRLYYIVEQDLEHIFLKIIKKQIQPESQKNKNYVYCTKLQKADGEIFNWNQKSSVILGLYRVLGHPYGTGVYLFYRNKQYEIMEMKRDVLYEYSIGICGAVTLVKGRSAWIKTLDGAVIISQLRDENNQLFDASQILHIGYRLNQIVGNQFGGVIIGQY